MSRLLRDCSLPAVVAGFVAVLVMGPGRYSIDARLPSA